jgi:hypothetical protein
VREAGTLTFTDSTQQPASLTTTNGQALALSNGSFTPSAYGGYITKLVVSYGSYSGITGAGTAINTGAGDLAIPVFVDTTINQTVDGGSGVIGTYTEIALTGSKTAIGVYGSQSNAYFKGTKTATTGNQLSAGVIGAAATAISDAASTGDLFDCIGVLAQAQLSGPNVINHTVSGVRSYGIVGAAAGGVASVRALNGGYFKVESAGRTVAESHGIQVDVPDGPQYISVAYGIRVQSQTGAGTSYGISVEGGNNQLIAGTATEVPLLVQGATSQSANLLECRNVSSALEFAVTPAGSVIAPNLPTSDPHVVGAIYSVAGTLHVSAG